MWCSTTAPPQVQTRAFNGSMGCCYRTTRERRDGRLGGSPVAMRRLEEYVPALKGMMAVYGYDGRGVGKRIEEGEMLR